MFKHFFLAIFLLATESASVFAQNNIDMAFDMMQRGEMQGAYEKFKDAAIKANVYGQFYLAVCYEKGYGVEKNVTEAFRYYRKTAEKGLAVGQRALANCYQNGIGVSKNQEKYEYWLNKSAGKYDPEDLSLLDKVYAEGSRYIAKGNKQPVIEEPIPQRDIALNNEKQDKEQIVPMSNVHEGERQKIVESEPTSIISDVDKNIPLSSSSNENAFAVIIANENYHDVASVPNAINDGKIFSEYCEKSLGMPKSNIHFVKDATYMNFRRELSWLKEVSSAYNGELKLVVYYAGHGIPDEKTHAAYLLPVDGIGSDVSTGMSLKDIYNTLNNISAQSIVVFLDACFSGAMRDGNMLASARGVAIKAKEENPQGNVVVLSAAQGDETAYPYKEKNHGLFTYYLLKKLQDTEGRASVGELAEYIRTNVAKKSIVLNGKSQTPTVSASPILESSWKNWTLK